MSSLNYISRNNIIRFNRILLIISAIVLIGLGIYLISETKILELTVLLSLFCAYLSFTLIYASRNITKIIFDDQKVLLYYSLGRMKSITIKNLHNISFNTYKRCDLIKLTYKVDRKPTYLRLKHFTTAERDKLFAVVYTAIGKYSQSNNSEYNNRGRDKHLYDFKYHENHTPAFYTLFSFSLLLPFSGIVLKLYDILTTNNYWSFVDSIDFGLLTTFIFPVAVLMFDKLGSKKTLQLKNGILTLSNDFTKLKEVNLFDTKYFYMDFRSIKWSGESDTRNVETIYLMSYSPLNRRKIREKIQGLILS